MARLILDFEDEDIASAPRDVESELCDPLAVPCVVLNSSGLTSISAALFAAGVKPGDKVACDVLQPYAALAISSISAVPVPIDVSPSRLTMDPIALAERSALGLKAVVATANFGVPSDVTALAQRTSAMIIEDQAQAFGSTVDGVPIASIPAMACFSFQSGKLLSCGFGGAVALSSTRLEAKVRQFVELGWWPRDSEDPAFASEVRREPGCRSARLPPIAAMLLGSRLPAMLAHRQDHAAAVRAVLDRASALGLDVQHAPEGFSETRWRVAMLAPSGAEAAQLVKQLRAAGSGAYRPRLEFFDDTFRAATPVTTSVLDRLVLLPVRSSRDAESESGAFDSALS